MLLILFYNRQPLRKLQVDPLTHYLEQICNLILNLQTFFDKMLHKILTLISKCFEFNYFKAFYKGIFNFHFSLNNFNKISRILIVS